MTAQLVRESAIAGSWYADNPGILKKEIHKYLDRVTIPSLGGDLVGLVVPHAGYMYSGSVAAFAYKLLEDQPFNRVLVLAPSHRVHFKGASVYDLGGYRTPLGVAPLDLELIDALLQDESVVGRDPRPHTQEHSLEIQLPFLQVVLKDFLLTPVIMGDQSFSFCSRLSEAIVKACEGKKVLLVASSDLSHYHSYDEAKKLDQIAMSYVQEFSPEKLSTALDEGKCEACGSGPIMTVMLSAAKLGADSARVLNYANSGDVTGDRQGVVGYMAVALFKAQAKLKLGEERKKVGVDLGLSEEEKDVLRQLAYDTIRSKCIGEPLPDARMTSPRLNERRGAFVCLHKGADLRGCIGMIEGKAPLHETVKKMAIQAAFADPRFCAIGADEIEDLHIEISVLTPLEGISDRSQIEIGRHGLFVRRGHKSGLLLPQVATEHGWSAEEFLEWTCKKAGLQTDAWKDQKTEVYVFSADVF